MGNSTNLNNDPVLTRIFRGYTPPDSDFIARDLLPIIPVGSRTGDIPNTGTSSQDWLRILDNDLITENDGTPIITTTVTKGDGWKTERRGTQHQVNKDDGARWNNSDWRAGMRQAEKFYTRLLKTHRLIQKEKRLADALLSTSVITNYVTLSGGDQFNDQASDPIGVFETARASIESNAHMDANVAVIPYPVFRYMVNHKQLKETTGISLTGTVPVLPLLMEQLKMALQVDKILVPKMKYESAKKGQTSSLARIWGNYILLAYVNQSPQPMEMQRSLGYTFELDAPTVDSYELQDPRYSRMVRMEEEYDDLLLDTSAAYLITAPIKSTLFI